MAKPKGPVRNPTPDQRGLGSAPVGWCQEQVDEWVRAKIKGRQWAPSPMPLYPTIIRKPELLRRVGLSHVTIWKLEREGKFPRRFPLVERGEAADAAE